MKKLLYALPIFGLLALAGSPTFAKPAKVDVCHATGNGSYHLINVSEKALPAHEGHGDMMPGDSVPGEEGLVLNENCELEEVGLDIQTTTVAGWPSVADSNDFGELNWQAEGRFGDNMDTGDWELAVGNNTQVLGEFDQEQHAWGDSPVMGEFMVEYDADTGIATFTVGDDSTDFEVGTDSADNLYLVARSSFGAGDYVELSELMLNGFSVGEDVMATDGDVVSLKIEGADLNEDFVVTGDVEMVYTSTAGSAPAFQLQVSSGI